MSRVTSARGQASLMMLTVVGLVLTGALVLFAFGNALGARAKHQRGADLAAISAAQVMRDLYPRLFEPPFLEPGVPNLRHLEQEEYLALARAAAVRGGRRNGVRVRTSDVTFPGGRFAPTRVRVVARGDGRIRVGNRRPAVPVRTVATAELSPAAGGAGMPGTPSGGGSERAPAHPRGQTPGRPS